MADPFVAEIRIFPFNFPPKGWAFCDGQLLPISQNTALFSLLGTTYGGDGKSTFALPDLQGSAARHPGQGPGLSLYDLGQQGGVEAVTLLESEMPTHSHRFGGATNTPTTAGDPTTMPPTPATAFTNPDGNIWCKAPGGRNGSIQLYHSTPNAGINPDCMIPAGGSLPHNNLQPYLTLNFCIALQGVFPPRT
jgi:microcystin-dependent protein